MALTSYKHSNIDRHSEGISAKDYALKWMSTSQTLTPSALASANPNKCKNQESFRIRLFMPIFNSIPSAALRTQQQMHLPALAKS